MKKIILFIFVLLLLCFYQKTYCIDFQTITDLKQNSQLKSLTNSEAILKVKSIDVSDSIVADTLITNNLLANNNDYIVAQDTICYSDSLEINYDDACPHTLVDKAYAQSLITAGIRFYMTDNQCYDVAGCSITQITIPDSPEIVYSKSGLVSDSLFGCWAAPETGTPTTLFLGEYNWNVFLNYTGVPNKNTRVYWQLVDHDADGSETIVATSSYTEFLTTTPTRYRIPLFLANDYKPKSTSRILGRLRVYSNTGTTTIETRIMGIYNSHWAIPTNVEILSTLFQEKGNYVSLDDTPYFTVLNDTDLFSDTSIVDDTTLITDTGCFVIYGDSYNVDLSDYDFTTQVKQDTGVFTGLFQPASLLVYPDYPNKRIIMKSDIYNFEVETIKFIFRRGQN